MYSIWMLYLNRFIRVEVRCMHSVLWWLNNKNERWKFFTYSPHSFSPTKFFYHFLREVLISYIFQLKSVLKCNSSLFSFLIQLIISCTGFASFRILSLHILSWAEIGQRLGPGTWGNVYLQACKLPNNYFNKNTEF